MRQPPRIGPVAGFGGGDGASLLAAGDVVWSMPSPDEVTQTTEHSWSVLGDGTVNHGQCSGQLGLERQSARPVRPARPQNIERLITTARQRDEILVVVFVGHAVHGALTPPRSSPTMRFVLPCNTPLEFAKDTILSADELFTMMTAHTVDINDNAFERCPPRRCFAAPMPCGSQVSRHTTLILLLVPASRSAVTGMRYIHKKMWRCTHKIIPALVIL